MKRRSGIKVMGQLIGLVVPLFHVMMAAIFFRCSRFFMCNLSYNFSRNSSDVFGYAGDCSNPY